VPSISEGQPPTFVCRRKQFPRVTAVTYSLYGDAAISDAMQFTLGYDTTIWRTWVMAADSNLSKIAAKPLQRETWILLTTYRNSSSLFQTVPSQTACDVPFSHNTHDWHSRVRNKPSKSFKVDNFCGI